jgi:sugar lactone lactonase YvrE
LFNVEGEVAVYDLAGQLVRKWALPTPVNGVAFANDGQRLVTANSDGTIVVLSLR